MCEAGPLICGELFWSFPTGTLLCVYSSLRMPPFHKFDMPFCCHGKPSLKIYISAFGLDEFFFFFFLNLCGLKPVAPRARFKCVWVFKDFSAEKPFGLQPHCHTLATELCHFRFLSHHWNQRKVQKRSKKHKTKADENGPDWIMSDLACASLWGKSSFCLITLRLTAKRIKKKKAKHSSAPSKTTGRS